jgi:ABC-type nitrate/sulfonate/bicarbonate transport system ATPase subunit
MRQRVSIARALAMDPQILILDEPFGALDAITREEMQDELMLIWARSKTTGLMVTHEIDEAILLSDRIVLMTNGPAATIGEIFDVPFARPRSREKLLEDPRYYTLRNRFMKALYEKFAHDDASA